jgi:hypothetical protein
MPKPFISELDQFLNEFDQQNPQKSKSQAANIKKHQERIFKLRDDPQFGKKKKIDLPQ